MFRFVSLACLLLCARCQRKMRTRNFSGACMVGVVVIFLRTGGLKGQASHRSAPLQGHAKASWPLCPASHSRALSRLEQKCGGPLRRREKARSEHRKSPPEGGSKVSLRLSRPAGSTEPRRPAGAASVDPGPGPPHMESRDCKGPPLVGARYNMPPFIACKIGKSHLALLGQIPDPGSTQSYFR